MKPEAAVERRRLAWLDPAESCKGGSVGAMGSGGKVELMPGAFRVLLRARELWFKKVELSKDVVVQACAFHLSV